MSGPIVRTAPTPQFSKNWDSVFGTKKANKNAAAKPTTKIRQDEKDCQDQEVNRCRPRFGLLSYHLRQEIFSCAGGGSCLGEQTLSQIVSPDPPLPLVRNEADSLGGVEPHDSFVV